MGAKTDIPQKVLNCWLRELRRGKEIVSVKCEIPMNRTQRRFLKKSIPTGNRAIPCPSLEGSRT